MLENAGQSPVGAWCAVRVGSDHDRGDTDRSGGQYGDRSGGHRRGGVVVSVGASARQRQEQPAGSDFAGIEFDGSRDIAACRVLGGNVGQVAADDGGDLRHGEGDHARRPSSAAASSTRSSNGWVCPARV